MKSIPFSDGKEFKIGIRDLLSAPVDAIVNPANSGLSHGGGLAAIISDEAGPGLDDECERIVKKIGRIPVTYAVPSKAYNLPFKGVIHAIGPRMGVGEEREKIEATINNALIVADRKNWNSLGFPAISTGIFGIPKTICANAFKNAVPVYWDTHPDTSVHCIWLCVTEDDFSIFNETLKV